MELPWEVFSIALHPTKPLLVTGFLEGYVSCHTYDVNGEITKNWQTKRHKGSCRAVEFSPDGTKLVTVGKDGVIKIADTETGKVTAKDTEAHDEPIDALKYVNEHIFVTGDDTGVIKVWDSRTMKTTHVYPDTHTDHITSFLPLPGINPYHVLSTSGDCTLSIFDLRKTAAVATSEDQEDELLSSSFADDSRRIIVGTQLGFITMWKSGEWLDHVDRIAPAERLRKSDEAPSVDCLCKIEGGVIVGSSDGVIRRLGFRPNKYLDVVGKCELGVTGIIAVPEMEGWIVSASGSKIAFWDTNATHNEEKEENDGDSSEEERSRKKRKKGKKGKKPSNVEQSAFFADL